MQISRRVLRINEFLEPKETGSDESMNFTETVSRIVSSSSEEGQQSGDASESFSKIGENGFLGPARESWEFRGEILQRFEALASLYLRIG